MTTHLATAQSPPARPLTLGSWTWLRSCQRGAPARELGAAPCL